MLCACKPLLLVATGGVTSLSEDAAEEVCIGPGDGDGQVSADVLPRDAAGTVGAAGLTGAHLVVHYGAQEVLELLIDFSPSAGHTRMYPSVRRAEVVNSGLGSSVGFIAVARGATSCGTAQSFFVLCVALGGLCRHRWLVLRVGRVAARLPVAGVGLNGIVRLHRSNGFYFSEYVFSIQPKA